MSSSTSKKTIIQRFDRENLQGYLSLSAYLQLSGVEILTQAGNLLLVPYSEIKTVSLVRDFAPPDPAERKLFATRPKTPGLWVRFRFRDNDVMDGLLANDLLRLETYGFSITPPDASSNTQRIFVPKAALSEIRVLAVVGSQPRTPKEPSKDQISLFETS